MVTPPETPPRRLSVPLEAFRASRQEESDLGDEGEGEVAGKAEKTSVRGDMGEAAGVAVVGASVSDLIPDVQEGAPLRRPGKGHAQ